MTWTIEEYYGSLGGLVIPTYWDIPKFHLVTCVLSHIYTNESFCTKVSWLLFAIDEDTFQPQIVGKWVLVPLRSTTPIRSFFLIGHLYLSGMCFGTVTSRMNAKRKFKRDCLFKEIGLRAQSVIIILTSRVNMIEEIYLTI